mgnify:FL=1
MLRLVLGSKIYLNDGRLVTVSMLAPDNIFYIEEDGAQYKIDETCVDTPKTFQRLYGALVPGNKVILRDDLKHGEKYGTRVWMSHTHIKGREVEIYEVHKDFSFTIMESEFGYSIDMIDWDATKLVNYV